MNDPRLDNMIFKDLNYNSYLKVPELLSLQQTLAGPESVAGETFFIVVHQTSELWFKDILVETDRLIQSFRENIVSKALKSLKRIAAVMNLLGQQLRLLSTLTPEEFSAFRDFLRPASGFQSAQYRVFEFRFGARNSFFLQFFENMPEVRAQLIKMMQEASVYDECWACLARSGRKLPDAVLKRDYAKPWEMNEALIRVIQDLYLNASPEESHWVFLFEAMLDFDENLAMWRKIHSMVVARTIGHKSGTGGSSGYDFLRSREDLRCFPELWEVRNYIGGTQHD